MPIPLTVSTMIKRLFGETRAEPWALPLIVGLGTVAALLESFGLYMFVPLVQSLGGGDIQTPIPVLDRLIASVPKDQQIPLFASLIIGFVLVKNVLSYIAHLVGVTVQSRVVHRARTRLFSQILLSGADYSVDSKRASHLSTIAGECWRMGEVLGSTYRIITSIITCVVFVTLLLLISWQLTLFSILAMAIAAGVLSLLTANAQSVTKRMVDANLRFGKRTWESFNSIRIIRSFGREPYEIGRYEQRSEELRRGARAQEAIWGIPHRFAEVAATLLIAALIMTSSRDATGVAGLVAFLAVLYRMQGPLRDVLATRVQLSAAVPVLQEIFDADDETARPALISGSIPFTGLEHGIQFRGVGFRYAESEPLVLENVSFTVPRGKTTAIVGPSGSGKSTLIDLLFRFRDPVDGDVLVDGVPLRELQLTQWRGRMAFMNQDVFLFDASVRENVAYGRDGVSEAEIVNALKIAHAWEFVEGLPQGLDTLVGERGGRLSGGQRQRIALARTIVRNPDILLLDEATNSLDSLSEKAFQEALAEFGQGRTLVVVAHRLATIEGADQVIMVENGHVVEQGDFQTLLAKRGKFARLYESQRLTAEV
jgi:subfamily B ATP-binding cassette protein MsbA